MNLVFSLVVGILFGTGAYMMLRRDLIRVVVGTNLIATAVIVLIIGASLFLGRAPIYPFSSSERLSDPLVQALALTAIVINYGETTIVLSLVYRIYQTQKTLDQDKLQQAEEREARALQMDQVKEVPDPQNPPTAGTGAQQMHEGGG